MKLIKLFITFVTITSIIGIGSAFNGDSISTDTVPKQEIVEKEDVGEKEEINVEMKDNLQDNEQQKEVEEPEISNDVKSENVQENISESTNKHPTQPETSTPNSSTKTPEQKVVSGEKNQIESTPVEKKIWEELGMTEYEYYNEPMLKWQKVTHSTFEECQKEGEEIINDPTSGYNNYWCYQVNSASGRVLGFMLKLNQI